MKQGPVHNIYVYEFLNGQVRLETPNKMENRIISLLQSSLSKNQVKQIHALVLSSYQNLTSSLLEVLSGPSNINHACNVFDRIPQPNSYFTNSIITNLSKLSLHKKVLRTLFLAHKKNTRLVHYSIAPVLKACTKLGAFFEGGEVHCMVIKYGVYFNVFIQSGLIDFYCKGDDLGSAKKVFEELVIKEAVPYNCLMSGYSKKGYVLEARRLFNEMPYKTQASWSTIISCYAHNGDLYEALKLFEQMIEEKVEPSETVIVTILSVCGKMGNLHMGMKVKKMIEGRKFRVNMIVRTALMEMYVKCGSVDEARDEFDRMDRRDVVAWSAMIAGYAQNGRSTEALELFEKMKMEKVSPNEVTLVSVLSACGQLGSVEVGDSVGKYIVDKGLASGVYVGSALVDMYSKCGNVKRARKIFDDMHEKDIVSWNSMIGGLAVNGFANDAIDLYHKMMDENFKPNEITFVGLLNACTHVGLVDLGLEFYNSMIKYHGVVPKVEHCSCMVDLFCKAGRLDEAYKFVCEMEIEPNVVIWSILLNACRRVSNVDLAEILVEKLLSLDPNNSAYYVVLSSMYADLGRWDDAKKVRMSMGRKNVQKLPAYSWIELDNETHKFLIEDKSHVRSDDIYNAVDVLRLHMKWENNVFLLELL